ncbi:MAG TPA: hypothetical protein VNI77_08050 [Nitrososphaera sp.]|nr:hypothetical protein [Nitrososphaera sp.]
MSNNDNGPAGESAISASRGNILELLDSFIDQIQRLRRIMLGMSVSAIILAPLAIALSLYLVLHPTFYAILETENEFGHILSIMLGAVIFISGIWLATGIRQYRSMSNWKTKYDKYSKEKEEMDKKIAARFGLSDQQD